jgi:hypothetical protein
MATCPNCGTSSRVDPEAMVIRPVLTPKPLGTFSLAGSSMKLSARLEQRLACRCGWHIDGHIDVADGEFIGRVATQHFPDGGPVTWRAEDEIPQDQLRAMRCPNCLGPLGRHDNAEGRRPGVGDVGMCWWCRALHIYDVGTFGFHLRPLTHEEQANALADFGDDFELLKNAKAAGASPTQAIREWKRKGRST